MKRRERDVTPDLEVLTFPGWRELRRRVPRLLAGIVLLGAGIAVIVRAELGVSPWDVFHQGVSHKTGIELGLVIVLVGLVVLVLWVPLRQRLGLGTILNTLGVGLVVNRTLAVVSVAHGEPLRWSFLIGGTLTIGLGTALYIGAGLGPGPRDGLMTALAARGSPLWLVRTMLELSALAAGWALGGNVGVGTILFAFGIGPLTHLFLEWLHLATPLDLGPGLAGE